MRKNKMRIGALVYQIERVEDLRDGDKGINGWFKHNDCLILIERNLAPQEERVVLWHEIPHAILNQAGIDEHDEQVIGALAYGIFGVLNDNSWLMEVANG